MRRQLLPLFLVLVWCAAPVCAQTEKAELRAKAFAVLESLAGELGSLQSPENRARIGSNIAGSIWEHDEKRARDLFALVQQDINTGLRIPVNPNTEDFHTLKVFMNLRGDTIERIAKHDPELAYSFFKATQFPRDLEVPFSIRLNEHSLEVRLAKQLASTNPDLSLELALKLLEPKITNVTADALRLLLRQLNRKHKEQALVLYKAMISQLKAADFVFDWESRNFAITLVNSVVPPAIDDAAFRELVGLFTKTAQANGCGKPPDAGDEERAEVCSAIASVLPQIAKVSPVRANELKRWRAETEYGERIDVFQEVQDLMIDGTVDDLLELASQHPEAAARIKWQAMAKARAKGDYERARKLYAELEPDEQRRNQWLKRFDQEESGIELDEQGLVEAQKRIAEIPHLTNRVQSLLTLAGQIATRNRANALKLLGQTADMIDTMRPGHEQSSMQLVLAVVYCAEKSDRGLAIMESMVPKLNELVEAAAKLDGYGARYLRDGEWNMSAEGSIGSLLTEIARSATYFAWCDFDRAVTAAGQFQRPEIRMMAQLKLAQGILAGPPRRLRFDSRGVE